MVTPVPVSTAQSQIKNVVLLDDDFVIRQVIKIVMADVGNMLGVNIKVYTSGNGVEGLGYIALSKPNILIVDSTLPKYSGRELIEFIASNPKYQTTDIRVIVLSDRKLPMKLPPNHVVLNKEDTDFVKQLTKASFDGLVVAEGEAPQPQAELPLGLFARFKLSVLGLTVRMANRADLLMAKVGSQVGVIRPFIYLYWFLLQVLISFLMGYSSMVNDKLPDENLSQKRADLARFRVREYPTLATIFLTLFFIMFQTVLLVAGGIVVFSVRIESVFADFNPEFNLDLSNAQYDPSKVELKNGKLMLREKSSLLSEDPLGGTIDSDVPDASIETPEELAVKGSLLSGLSTEAVMDTDVYPYDNPEIVIATGVEYSRLLSIIEVSNINDALSSVKTVAETGLSIPSVAVTYQLSPDGNNWYYLNLIESQWQKTTLGLGQSNTIQQVNQFLPEFDQQIAVNKKLHLKLFFHSNGAAQIVLSGLKINRVLDVVTTVEELP